jgi:hypothetical protein
VRSVPVGERAGPVSDQLLQQRRVPEHLPEAHPFRDAVRAPGGRKQGDGGKRVGQKLGSRAQLVGGIILVCIVVAKLLPNKWNYDGKRLFMVICYATIVLFGGIAWDNYMEKKVLGEKAFFSEKERATSSHSDGKTAGPLVIKTDSTRSMLRDSIVGDYYYAQVVVDTLDGRIILGKDKFYTWITMEEHNGTVIIDFDLDDY